jgi:hypothetical protein
MTFELVRCGWPNAMTIVALAAMPFVSLAISDEQRPPPTQIVESVDETRQTP